ncbi:unnamed protein product [Euphydryas editha]|uniref:Uncharacterized protein n=1 Tax=Euphydryas editha TaxID=104508 RepID=A0AAU9UTI7_EUPED|nr:unnamed protein product [Euphydryas editha]
MVIILRQYGDAEEEEWVDEDNTDDIQDALSHSNKDDEETQEETKRIEMAEKEQDIEQKCEDVVADTENSKKRSGNFDYEDVDGCASAMAASRRASAARSLLYDPVPAYLRPFTINLHQTPWTSNIYMLIRSQF